MIDLNAVRRAIAEADPFPSSEPITRAMHKAIVHRIEQTLEVESGTSPEDTHRGVQTSGRSPLAPSGYGSLDDQSTVDAASGVIGVRRRPVIVAVAAALAAIAMIAVPALLGYWLHTDIEAPTEVPTTVVTPTTVAPPSTTVVPTTTTVPPIAGLPITWERVPHDTMFEDVAFADAASNDERVVLVGGGDFGEDAATMTAAVWVSDDGSTWTRIQDRSFTETFADGPPPWWTMGMSTVAHTGDLFVAGGHAGNDAAVWTSPDGLEWSRIDPPTSEDSGLSTILAVTAGESGIVAVGQDDLDAGVWFSPDGTSWEAVDDPDLHAGGDIVSALVFDVVEGGPGYVAVGWVQLANEDDSVRSLAVGEVEQAAVWVSVDGRDWILTDLDQFADEYIIASLAVDPEDNSLIGFGWEGLWRSTDGVDWFLADARGTEWTSLPPPGASIAWYRDGAVAAAQDSALALWTSADHGTSWLRTDPESPAFEGHRPAVTKVVSFKDRVLAFGVTGEYLSEVPAVWIGDVTEAGG